MNLAPIIRQSLELWQSPPLTELPPETIVGAVNRCISERFLDLDLTVNACFATAYSSTFQFSASTSRERDITALFPDNLSRILRVESRRSNSTSEDDWAEERHASFENWNDISERSDGDFVAFYGVYPNLTMRVARDVSSLEFRIVYQEMRDKIEAFDDEIELPAVYETALVYDLSLEFAELIDNQSPEFAAKKADKVPYLMGRLQDCLARIEKWRKSQKGSSPTHRRAFSDRSAGAQTGRRRFTITY